MAETVATSGPSSVDANANGQSTPTGTTTPATPVPDYVFTDPIVPPQFIGHLGHLTKAQTEALDAFKDLVAKEGLYRPASISEDGTSAPASHDDVTLL